MAMIEWPREPQDYMRNGFILNKTSAKQKILLEALKVSCEKIDRGVAMTLLLLCLIKKEN